MNKKLCSAGFVLILLVGLVSASSVGYIYRSESKIDLKVVEVFNEMGFKTDFINEKTLTNLSNYNFIYVGDEYFTNVIPTWEYNSIISNYHLGKKSGITDNDGISQLASKHNLNVNIDGKLLPVYNKFVDSRGIAISYYYLSDNNKVSGFKRYAGTDTTSSGNPFGDVISFGEKGLTLSNGKISKGYTCFFGIFDSKYWTEEAKDLLKQCITFTNKPLGGEITLNESNGNESNTITCSKNFDCGTNVFFGNPSCSSNNVFQNFINFTCVNSGTQTSYCTNETKLIFVESCGLCLSGICQTIQCFNNSDCNDGNVSTHDVCLSSGTINSVCSHNLPGRIQIGSFFGVPLETSVQLNFSTSPTNDSETKGYWLSINRNEWLWTTESNYTFIGLSASTSYTFYIKAEDKLNQTSSELNISVTTLALSSSPVVSSGGGGSSATGAGAGNGLCITQWNCSSWTECKNSKQTRVCTYPDYYCNATAPKPIEKQSCVDINRTRDLVMESDEKNSPINNTLNRDGWSFITGAVIGAMGEYPFWILIVFLVLIVIGYLYWKFKK